MCQSPRCLVLILIRCKDVATTMKSQCETQSAKRAGRGLGALQVKIPNERGLHCGTCKQGVAAAHDGQTSASAVCGNGQCHLQDRHIVECVWRSRCAGIGSVVVQTVRRCNVVCASGQQHDVWHFTR